VWSSHPIENLGSNAGYYRILLKNTISLRASLGRLDGDPNTFST